MRRDWAAVLLIGFFISVLVSASPAHAGRLYWSRNFGDVGGHFDNSLATVRTNGTGFFELNFSADNHFGAVAVDSASGRLYWVENNPFDGYELVRGDASGCRRLQLDAYVPWIALDVTGGKIYWTEGGGRILRANLDLSSVEVVLEGLSGDPREIGVDSVGGKLYWHERADGEIVRSNLDGSDVEVQFEVSGLEGMQIDSVGQKIYWGNFFPGGFRRADFDGSNVEELAPQVQRKWVVDASGGRVYWRSDGAIPAPGRSQATISRADLDGSNEALVLYGDDANAGFLAFDPSNDVIPLACGTLVPALGLRSAGLLVLLLLGVGAWALKRS
jgi:hypothetical protein